MLTINGIEERAKQVFSAYPVNEVSLFGSYARGSQTEDSDIDFLIKKSDLSLLTISLNCKNLIYYKSSYYKPVYNNSIYIRIPI